jgi:hypothetical protein
MIEVIVIGVICLSVVLNIYATYKMYKGIQHINRERTIEETLNIEGMRKLVEKYDDLMESIEDFPLPPDGGSKLELNDEKEEREQVDLPQWMEIANELLENEPNERVDERDDINLIGGLTMPVRDENVIDTGTLRDDE